jgi:hypothetical protein
MYSDSAEPYEPITKYYIDVHMSEKIQWPESKHALTTIRIYKW